LATQWAALFHKQADSDVRAAFFRWYSKKRKQVSYVLQGRLQGTRSARYYGYRTKQPASKDNGLGMPHDKLPDMLGRGWQLPANTAHRQHTHLALLLSPVLSGSKYGVRQTRGKFGLGAKMVSVAAVPTAFSVPDGGSHQALIWSKKSTGLPIEVVTGYSPNGKTPKQLTYCKLDIDIYKVHLYGEELRRLILRYSESASCASARKAAQR
jgi:hypothetical protein